MSITRRFNVTRENTGPPDLIQFTPPRAEKCPLIIKHFRQKPENSRPVLETHICRFAPHRSMFNLQCWMSQIPIRSVFDVRFPELTGASRTYWDLKRKPPPYQLASTCTSSRLKFFSGKTEVAANVSSRQKRALADSADTPPKNNSNAFSRSTASSTGRRHRAAMPFCDAAAREKIHFKEQKYKLIF